MNEGSKFVLVGPAHPFRGGIAHFGDALARQLQMNGNVVPIYNFRRLYPSLIFPGKTQFEPGTAPVDSARGRCIDTLNPWTWISSARRIAREQPDAVFFQYWEPWLAPVFGTMARDLVRKKVKVFCIVHNALPHQYRPGASLLGRYFLGSCNGLVALSSKVEDDLARVIKLKVPVRRLYHPLYRHFGDPIPQEEARKRLRLGPKGRVILFFGIVRPYKGLLVLLKALKRVIEQLRDARLVVAGEFYENPEMYRAFIKTHSLENHVRLEERYIPREEVADYFCAADVVALPYLSGSQSGVLSAALHFERPCIVSEAGGIAEMIPPDSGMIVAPGDAADLGEALLHCFQNGHANDFSETIRRHKETYSWTRFSAAITEM